MNIKRDVLVEAILDIMNNPSIKEIQGIKVRAWQEVARKDARAIATALKKWHKENIKKELLKKCKKCSYKQLIERKDYEQDYYR